MSILLSYDISGAHPNIKQKMIHKGYNNFLEKDGKKTKLPDTVLVKVHTHQFDEKDEELEQLYANIREEFVEVIRLHNEEKKDNVELKALIILKHSGIIQIYGDIVD